MSSKNRKMKLLLKSCVEEVKEKGKGALWMPRKHILIIIIAWIVEISLTYWVAKMFSVRFIEVMFFTGVAFTLGTFYFSSSGGAMSRFYTSQVSAQTGIIHERERFKVKLGPVFIASLLFFLIGLVFFILLVTGIIPPQKVWKLLAFTCKKSRWLGAHFDFFALYRICSVLYYKVGFNNCIFTMRKEWKDNYYTRITFHY